MRDIFRFSFLHRCAIFIWFVFWILTWKCWVATSTTLILRLIIITLRLRLSWIMWTDLPTIFWFFIILTQTTTFFIYFWFWIITRLFNQIIILINFFNKLNWLFVDNFINIFILFFDNLFRILTCILHFDL